MTTAKETGEGDQAPPPASGFWASSKESAKAWGAVAVAFFGVLALAAFLFTRHRRERAAELDTQFAQNVARLGREVELKYKNYRVVVDNVTRILMSADVGAATEEKAKFENAMAEQQKSAQRSQMLKARAALASQRQAELKRIKDWTVKANDELGLRLSEAKSSYDTAQLEANAAQEVASLAELQFQKKAAAVLGAERDVERAEVALAMAPRATDAASSSGQSSNSAGRGIVADSGTAASMTSSARLDDGGAAPAEVSEGGTAVTTSANSGTPPSSAKVDAPAPTATDAAAPALSLTSANEALIDAKKKLAEAQRDFNLAHAHVSSSWADATAKDAKVTAAWNALTALQPLADPSRQAVGAVIKDNQKAGDEARRVQDALSKEQKSSRELSEAAKAAANLSSAAKVRSRWNALNNLVLPSQRPRLDSCSNEATVEALNLCVAKQMADVNEVRGLEMVACPSASTVPSVSPDGRYLLIPPSVTGEKAERAPEQSERASESSAASEREAANGTGGRTADDASGAKNAPPSRLPACGRLKIRKDLLESGAEMIASHTNSAARGAFESILLLHRDGTTVQSRDDGSNLVVSALPGIEAKHAASSSMLSNVAIGTTKYRAFLQPVRLRLDNGAKEGPSTAAATPSAVQADLIVCGLVSEDQLDKASLEIRLRSYLWVVLLLGLGLLSLPLAKLWLLGPKTSFRAFDVTGLGTSAMLLTLLGTVLALAFLAQNRLAARADRQLEYVGDLLQKRLADRIAASTKALAKFNETTVGLRPFIVDNDRSASPPSPASVQPPTPQQQCEAADGKFAPGIIFNGDGRSKAVCERTKFQLGDVDRKDWKVALLLDKDGNERVKFVPEKDDSTAVSLKRRQYFQRAFFGDLACLDPDCSARGVPDLVRSVTSGGIVLAVAQPIAPSTDESTDDQRPSGVSVMVSPIDELRRMDLPLGVQAMVIDERGQVMPHSSNDQQHERELFDEVDDSAELRAALATKVPDTISINYLGQPSRMHIAPVRLPRTSWSVVTIAPTAIVDVATTDMVLATLFAYGALLALTLLAACLWLVSRRVAAWLRGRDLTDHAHAHDAGLSFRPRADRSRDYADVGLFSIRAGAVVCALALLTTRIVPTTVGLMAVLVLCGIAVRRLACSGNVGAAKGVRAPAKRRDWRDYLPLTYLLCCAGLAEVFVMAPSAVLFAGAYDHVADNLVRAEQEHFAAKLEDREECFEFLPSGKAWPSAKAIPRRCRSVFGSGDEQVVDAGAANSTLPFLRARLLSPVPYLADFLPAVGSADAEDSGRLYRIGTIGQTEPPSTGYATVRQPTEVTLVSTVPWTRASRSVSGAPPKMRALISTSLPALIGTDYGWLALIVLVLTSAAAIAAAYVVGFHSLRRMLFLDVLMNGAKERPVLTGQSLLAQDAIPKKVLARFASPEIGRTLRDVGNFQELVLTAEPVVGAPVTSKDRAIVSDLDTVLNDEKAAQRLSSAARLPGTIVLLAGSDPLDRVPVHLRKIWARVLEQFEWVELTQASTVSPVPISNDATVTRWWYECSETERSVLTQLALSGFATPHPANVPAIETLAAKGLLDANTMTILHPELADLARRLVTPNEQKAWAEADRGTGWTALRVPLTTGVAALLAAVTISKPELGVASAVVPTLAASVPSVLKMLLQMMAPKGE